MICISQTYNGPNQLGRFRQWTGQVESLRDIGIWSSHTLPPNTLVAAEANGSLSYYSQLPTIDLWGLTDEHIAFAGQRFSHGVPGHIAYDCQYVVLGQPAILSLSGGGFSAEPVIQFGIPEYETAYDGVSFRFIQSTSASRQYINLMLLMSQKQDVILKLTNYPEVEVAEGQ
jgi:hypothetical protein